MIKEYKLGDPAITLNTDLAAEDLLYIYMSNENDALLYSKSLADLLEDSRVEKPLRLSPVGISFLLQSGVVPPPRTVYQDIYVLGIGDAAKVTTRDGVVQIDFEQRFPFFNKQRLSPGELNPNEDHIVQLLAEATINRLVGRSESNILFHSAGKDSNALALALAEAGWQDRVTLVCHKSKGDADETEISQQIAKKLGFKHEVLTGVDQLGEGYLAIIRDYFRNVTLPSTDGVTLGYPLYLQQLPELAGSNLIDGMGSDVYIGHVPSASEYKKQKHLSWSGYLWPITQQSSSTGIVHAAAKTRAEWTGLTGFSFADARLVYPDALSTKEYWSKKSQELSHLDYFDFRAVIRGGIIDSHIFMRKVRNFAEYAGAQVIFPWANDRVAGYFSKLPEHYLFDRNKLKNKLILRDMLKSRIGLDSDKLGKKGFHFNFRELMINSRSLVEEEIFACPYWDPQGARKVYGKLASRIKKRGRTGAVAGMLVHRMYVLSAWLNHNRYIN